MEPTYKSPCGRVTLYLADCLKVLPTLGKVGCVITDPPYGIDGGKGAVSKARAKGAYSAAFEDTPEFIKTVAAPAVAAALSLAHRGAVTPGSRHMWLYPIPAETGCFYYPAGAGVCSWGFNCWQPILFYGKSPNAGTLGHANARKSIEGSDSSIDHPCPKPIRDWMWLVDTASKAGETILDPFMGSGTTGVAALRHGCSFIGIEIEPKYFEIAKRRILAELAQRKMF